jgi:hypothetical protein
VPEIEAGGKGLVDPATAEPSTEEPIGPWSRRSGRSMGEVVVANEQRRPT